MFTCVDLVLWRSPVSLSSCQFPLKSSRQRRHWNLVESCNGRTGDGTGVLTEWEMTAVLCFVASTSPWAISNILHTWRTSTYSKYTLSYSMHSTVNRIWPESTRDGIKVHGGITRTNLELSSVQPSCFQVVLLVLSLSQRQLDVFPFFSE